MRYKGFSGVYIHPTAEVSPEAAVGQGCKIWHQAQVREGATIGKDAQLGKDVYIDQGVVIGNKVKIQNGVSIYYGVILEDEVFVGPHVTFTNDLYPRAFNSNWVATKTKVLKGASIGANATIVCGITIGRYAMVGAGAVVTHDVPDFALCVGNPARVSGYVCYCGHPLVQDNSCPVCQLTIDVDNKGE